MANHLINPVAKHRAISAWSVSNAAMTVNDRNVRVFQ
jgi:hypothetical protein